MIHELKTTKTIFSKPGVRHVARFVMIQLLILISLIGVAIAQSKDRNRPTQLSSKEISGVIGGNVGESYFYSFRAGPGDVTIKLSVEAGDSPSNAVNFELRDDDNRPIMSSYL